MLSEQNRHVMLIKSCIDRPLLRIVLFNERFKTIVELSEPFKTMVRVTIPTTTNSNSTETIIIRQFNNIRMVSTSIRAYSENLSLMKNTKQMAIKRAIRNCKIISRDKSERRLEKDEPFDKRSPISLRRPLILETNRVIQFTKAQITSIILIKAKTLNCLISIGPASYLE